MKFFNIVFFLFRILNLIFPFVLPFLFVESWIPTVHHGWSDSVAVQPRPVQRRHMYETGILYMIEPSSTRYLTILFVNPWFIFHFIEMLSISDSN